jgi:hypothetical protein
VENLINDPDAGGTAIGVFAMVLIVGFGYVLPIYLSVRIWRSRGGTEGIGFLMGFLLGWIGVIIAAVANPTPTGAAVALAAGPSAQAHRECPFCKENMRRDASVCPHCRHESKPWLFHQEKWWVKGEDGGDYWLNEQTNEWVKWRSPLPPTPA